MGELRYVAVLSLAATLSWAQVLLDPQSRQGQAAKALLDRPSATGKLPCKVQSMPPTLNFALRYSGGYRATVPLAQLPPEGTTLAAVFRVQAQGSAQGAYFRHLYRLPKIPPNTKLWVLLDGGFFLGEGRYEVDWLLTDLEGRECRSRWRVELRPKEKDRPSRQLMGPGEVASLRLTSWKPRTKRRPFRIAVFLHVAPIRFRATMLSPFDQSVLLTTLTSLFESGPFEESSVVAFSLQKQRELYRVEGLTNQRLQKLLQVMDDLELGTIDVREMNDPRRYLNLLANMVNREQASDIPPDAMVFVGPQNRYDFKFPKDFLENVPPERRPPMFYLRYSYFLRYVPFADSIEKLVKSQGGKVFNIAHPAEFLAALRKMEETLRERAAALPAPSTSGASPESDTQRREP